MQRSATHSKLTSTDILNTVVWLPEYFLKVGIAFKFVASPMTKPTVELHLERESTITSQVMDSKHTAKAWEQNQ